MAEVKLQARGISKHFITQNGTALTVLQDVNIAVEDGEFVALVGASGCGKTTLLRILDGLIRPDNGQVLLDGREVHDPGPNRGFVFQSDNLLPWRNVVDNVAFGLEVQGVSKREGRSTAQKFIRLVGLAGFESSYPHQLSGGMRQRANLARAFTLDPEVLLMDEPFASLDAQTREIMQRELLRIWNDQRKTVAFVTHQIDEAVYLADRIIVMTARPGRVKESVRIDLPRPRPLDVKRQPEFVAYVDRVWKMIEDEVSAAITLGEV